MNLCTQSKSFKAIMCLKWISCFFLARGSRNSPILSKSTRGVHFTLWPGRSCQFYESWRRTKWSRRLINHACRRWGLRSSANPNCRFQ